MPGLIPEPAHPTPLLRERARHTLPEAALACAVSPSGHLALVSAGGPVDIVDAALRPLVRRDDHAGGTCAAAFSVRGAYASGGLDGSVVVVDDLFGSAPVRRALVRGFAEPLAFSDDGARLAVGRTRGVVVFDTATLAVLHDHDLPATPTAVQFTEEPRGASVKKPKGFESALAVACRGGLHVWSARGAGAVRVYPWNSPLLSLCQSPDGRYYAAGCHDGAVHVWRRTTGDDFEMSGYPRKVRALAFSDDSRFMATGGGPLVTVWDYAGAGPQGTTPRELHGLGGTVVDVGFTAAGHVCASDDRGVTCVWSLAGRHPVLLGTAPHQAGAVWLRPRADDVVVGHVDGVVLALSWRTLEVS